MTQAAQNKSKRTEIKQINKSKIQNSSWETLKNLA
jgi:hypothetical protein